MSMWTREQGQRELKVYKGGTWGQSKFIEKQNELEKENQVIPDWV